VMLEYSCDSRLGSWGLGYGKFAKVYDKKIKNWIIYYKHRS